MTSKFLRLSVVALFVGASLAMVSDSAEARRRCGARRARGCSSSCVSYSYSCCAPVTCCAPSCCAPTCGAPCGGCDACATGGCSACGGVVAPAAAPAGAPAAPADLPQPPADTAPAAPAEPKA